MFKELKLKIAARRVGRKTSNSRRRNTRKAATFWGRVWNVICAPFRLIARIAAAIWAWIRSIDLIGLVNTTLLVAIIVLFSMLIINIIGCGRKNVIIVADAPAIAVATEKPQITLTDESAPAAIKPRPDLPIRRDPATRKFQAHTVDTSTVKCDTNPVTMYGDVIIDRRGQCPALRDGVHITGSLYLQNMRKYTLPCGAVIDGNLFLRDVEMLQFCGDFTVKGNIYVSPRSSFGPIPRTARLGGQVIL